MGLGLAFWAGAAGANANKSAGRTLSASFANLLFIGSPFAVHNRASSK
jgi:hypothetical protein